MLVSGERARMRIVGADVQGAEGDVRLPLDALPRLERALDAGTVVTGGLVRAVELAGAGGQLLDEGVQLDGRDVVVVSVQHRVHGGVLSGGVGRLSVVRAS